MLDEDVLSDPPETLWQYTTFAGLQGILRGKLWASCVRFLNDANEFRQGTDRLQQALATQVKGAPGHPNQAARSALLDYVTRYAPRYGGEGFYVACLSASRDDLSQWRAYADRGGPAYAIGFNGTALASVAKKQKCQLKQVIYDQKTQQARMNSIVSNFLKKFDANITTRKATISEDAYANSKAIELVNEITDEATLFKHEKFHAEGEWRLILPYPQPPLKFRESGSLAVPYKELELHKLPEDLFATRTAGTQIDSPITHVMLGPSPHPTENKVAQRLMAFTFCMKFEIEVSEIPYRNW
jgi:hypothetical protein